MFYSRAYTHIDNNQRRSVGVVFVVLIHLGLVIAISNGLIKDTIFHQQPPFVVRTIDPPKAKPTPPEPIDSSTFIKKISITNPVPSTTSIATVDPKGSDTMPNSQPTENTYTGEAQITEASVDPRDPLTQPNYPAASRRLNEEGTVELLLYVLSDGRIGAARIDRSSGFARLDEAAQQHALQAWRLLPQQIDGNAMAGWHRIAITFRLKK